MFSSEVERTISCLNVLFHADPFFSKRGTFPVHNPDELLLACADGILLLRLALLISPGVINPTRIYHNVDLTPFRNRIVLRAQRGADPTPAGINQITQNFDLLAAALARIPAFSNVRVAPSDVLSLNHAAVFSAASELLRGALVSRVSLLHHPCLVKLVREGESIEELMRLGTADLMGRWITYHLGQEEEGEETLLVPSVLPRLISKVAPEASAAAASSPLEALRQLGCAVAVTEEELSEGSEGAVALAVAALLDRCPGIEFPSLEEFYVCEEQIRLLRVKVYELECQVDLSYTRDEMFEEINAAIEAKAAEREALEQRVQELSAHTRLMRETAAEYRQREASLSQRVGEERSQAEQEQKELADNKGAIVEDKIREINSEAEAKLAERDEVLRQLEEEIARDEAALAAEKKKKRPSEQELAKLRSSLKQLQDDMAAAETPAGKQPGETSEKRSAQLAAELEQNKATLTKAEQTIRELEQAVARLQADVTAAKQPLLAPKKKGSSTSNSSSDNRSGSKGLRDEFKMSKETIKEVAKCMSQTLSPSASTTATAAAATTAAPSNRKGHNGKAAAQLALVAQALLEVKADMDAQAARVEGQLDKNLEMEELLQVKMDQLAKVQKSKRRMFYFF